MDCALLDGVDRVIVVAHSIGGEVATAFSEINPKRIGRLIYIDSPPTAGATHLLPFRTAHESNIAYRTRKPPHERLAALKPAPPLLAIVGSRDSILPLDYARHFAQAPGAKVAMIEGAGHSPMVEDPARTLELIRGLPKPAR